ncbi:MAG: aminoglycoside phosphotransferase [Lysobacterales bacterium]|nr:MAG: aminoglycoside phosphotransferase [Xanthomonadales bacterium]
MNRAHESEAPPRLVRQLLEPATWPHEVRRIQLIETHISWVILTGDFAYKVKKPVDLGFLDFSTLELRRRYCEEELRVNRRWAAGLYLGVVPIGEGPGGLRMGLEPAVEYAVRMRQFPHEARLDRCLQDGRLGPAEMRRLAETIARLHAALPPRRDGDPAYEVDRATRPSRNNFTHLDPAAFDDEGQQRLAVIEAWTLQQAEALAPEFARRAREGAVRECHGDLHLENLLLQEGRFVPFDAIEFNPDLRWIDIANDIAFLVMDLMAHERTDFAYTVLNAWLEATGAYDSLAVMRFYLANRSMVRAVVTAIRHRQTAGPAEVVPGGEPQRSSARLDKARYVELAASLVDTPPPRLCLMHGFSGSGKTWFSERLVGALPALRVRSDLERKRLSGEQMTTGVIESGLYGAEVTERTYEILARHCETGLRAGFDMIADATFLRRRHREQFRALAARLDSAFVIVDCAAPPALLEERLRRRLAGGADASDADLAVLHHQLAHCDPLTEQERERAVVLQAGSDTAAAAALIHAAAVRR